jgi:Fur family peroxide stress response transcriptional regulator
MQAHTDQERSSPLPGAADACRVHFGSPREYLDLDSDSFLFYNHSTVAPKKRMERLRNVGISPTIQRLAILEFLENTESHPTADQVYTEIQKAYPTIARATVYNTLEALTKAGAVHRLNVESTAARYDANTSPHGHFRCRVCQNVCDIRLHDATTPIEEIDGHKIEVIYTYAYGICADCLKSQSNTTRRSPDSKKASSSPSANTTQRDGGG